MAFALTMNDKDHILKEKKNNPVPKYPPGANISPTYGIDNPISKANLT